ncbi:MAG: hypothetical protein QOJ45_1965 [Verrucomicrobiota bacterium]|jgi:hypothetical protein
MEIMRTPTSSFGKLSASVGCFLLCAAAPTLFASDVVLQKVPLSAAEQSQPSRPQSHLGPQASFALINYNLRDARTKAHALYVSSGKDLKLADNMIDDQAATTFGFAPEDNSPTAVIDLGKVSTLRRISAVYSARAGAIDFYVMQSLPGVNGENNPDSLKLDSKTFANLRPIGSAIDDGTQGRASIDFPATAGRYIMLRWSPAAHADTAFTVAEVSAFSPSRGNILASNRNFSSNATTSDSKDIADSKDIGDSKDIPEEGPPPAPPAEGPPPSLPNPPPFTFIPQLLPVSD